MAQKRFRACPELRELCVGLFRLRLGIRWHSIRFHSDTLLNLR